MRMIVPFFLPVNHIEVCFHGMARSGNHAVINWILSMYPGKTDFWNTTSKVPKKYFFKQKSFLLRSHENRSLAEIFQSDLEKQHDLYIGKSSKRYNVLLIRDPFNLFASRLKQVLNQNFDQSKHGFIMGHPKYKYGASKPEEYVGIWKEHAKEYLGITSYLGNDKITINYSQWFLDSSYREKIANLLKLKYTDENLNKVVGEKEPGAGSSFDQYEYNGQADQMKVLERWKNMIDNPNYCSLFTDREVWELSEQIFGVIPGTEALSSYIK
ncbi:MAG: hypothetical protein AB4063_21380 [Crocosphaera sp.]